QFIDAHSLPAVHAAPGGFGPQLPFTHAAPATQSAAVVQLDRHFPSPPHRYWPHESLLPAVHSPSPSQREAWVTVDAAHACALQIVPVPYTAQRPVPSQEPLRMQPVTPSSGQSLRGSAPTGTFMQLPALPGCAHDWQRPEQSERQQTLSKQKPLLQSSAIAHTAPISAPVVTVPPPPPVAPAPPAPPPPSPPVPVVPPAPVMSMGASAAASPWRCSPPPPQPAASNASSESRRTLRMESREMGVRSTPRRARFAVDFALLRAYLAGRSSSSGTS